ncbi:LacI family DNA-binding transcriptional regulator [Paenarthrobacter nitroguajacolicus]|uniref:LacI family DNA-binding transcriptional regulator n=1 Tax=Paenarthrobacter nitroguajacolicus TaxID=211146 RepID=UPI0028548079|nr:LacI family DNA-binding transcriptional regulator [Paenarthrobacter nitroguajacolicus]MDR6640158.1 DNA-binding LacI/PurR family transcriptional regulator [Paenarthrobacter nitroguajacolicus]
MTIQDVAVLSGLSICTVSRALRNLPNVSDKARHQVAEAASKLGYKPSAAASRLAGGSTRSVAIVAPTATAWFFAQTVEAAEEVLGDSGYDTVLISLRNKATVRRQFFADLSNLAQRVDGVLLLNVGLAPGEVEALVACGLPVASVGMRNVPWDNVGIDDEHAAWQATQHLLGLGHWDLAVLSSNEHPVVTETPRFRGFRRALDEHHLTVHPDSVVAAGPSIDDGRRAMAELITRGARPTAVFAHCDEAAFGVLTTLREHGLSVPKHVSVVGIDDHPMSGFLGLSTVAQPVADQGAFAASLLCERLLNTETPHQPANHLLDTKLIERKTTRHKR